MGNCLCSSGVSKRKIKSKGINLQSPPVSKDGFKSTAQILPTPRTQGEILASPNLKAFTFTDLKVASKSFRPEYLLGEGGFGCVFKGWIDQQTLTPAKSGSGMVVAIKRLKSDCFQGHKQWLTEVDCLGQLHHPNLVKLIGYCLEGEDRLLVYEFMPKGSLENHLFRRGAQPLSWATRIKVAIGAAKGLSFLHEARIIFRDFKASNILLDSEFNSKLSDFGLAKEGPTGDQTHISTQLIGTQGYAAPEYMATGRISERSDVYSFGVVLLELMTGRTAIDNTRSGLEQSLVDWTRPCLRDKRKLFRIMDSSLQEQYSQKDAMTLASLALDCLESDPKERPKMPEVLAQLVKVHDRMTTAKTPQRTPSRSPLNVTPMGSPLHLAAYQQSPCVH
ncbi:hypothetical protein V2J09_015384 [Rumex salicifolius]